MGRVREAWIDESRGFAMLLIVFGHICTEDFARSFVWSFHVPLFMIIAGLTYRPKASFLGEVSHRARRLLIPYLVWGGDSTPAVFGAGASCHEANRQRRYGCRSLSQFIWTFMGKWKGTSPGLLSSDLVSSHALLRVSSCLDCSVCYRFFE